MPKKWKVYLSGEVHSNWRQKISTASKKAKLPIEFLAPVTRHDDSDACGASILGAEEDKFWYDHKGAKVNAIRTKTLIEEADVVVVRFGDKYKQWNAAFDAGYASALNVPLIVEHPKEYTHALKEVDATALAVCESTEQVVRILKYVVKGRL